MTLFDQFIAALMRAVAIHKDSVDKAGDPVLFHVIRVIGACQSLPEKIVAALHDSFEDDPEIQGLSGPAIVEFIRRHLEGFDEEIVEAAIAITRIPEEDRETYLKRVSENFLALKVKIRDNRDNQDISRYKKPLNSDRSRCAMYRAEGRLLEIRLRRHLRERGHDITHSET